MTFTIRAASIDDCADIAKKIKENHIQSKFRLTHAEAEERVIHQMCEGNDYWIAEDEGNIIGFTFGRIVNVDTYRMEYVCVATEHRQKGVAHQLGAKMISFATELGASQIQAYVQVNNKAGNQLQLKLGLSPFKLPWDEICYSRKLQT